MSIVELLSSLAKDDIRLWLEGENLRYSAPEGKFTADVRSRIVANKAAIVEFLKQAQARPAAAIPRVPRDTPIKATHGQSRLWVVDKINPGDVTYNIPAAFRLTGDLDARRLEAAFRQVIARHESLRTLFRDVEGEPVLDVVLQPDAWTLSTQDVSDRGETEEAQAREAIRRIALTPFNLASDWLLRAHLLVRSARDGKPCHDLVLCMHHIVSDAWSMEVLIKEVVACYGLGETAAQALPELPIQFADYAAWTQSATDSGLMKAHLDYWLEHLRGAAPVLRLPTDHARSDLYSMHGATYDVELPAALCERIEAACRKHDLTPFMLTLSRRLAGGRGAPRGGPTGRRKPPRGSL